MSTLRRLSRNWYYLASVVWVFILACEWYRFTEPVWLNQTSHLVLYTLIATAAAEFLPVGSVIRWLVKLGLIIIIHIRVLGIYKLFGVSYAYLALSDKIRLTGEQLSPYLWFSVASWALFELAVRVVDRRSRILLFLGLNIVAFTILDSFTPYSLWTETAWSVFAGMAWLVSHHFRRMELNHPKGWTALRRRPLRILANITIVFAAVMWIGVSMPKISPVLDDPYTIIKDSWYGGDSSNNGGSSSGSGSGQTGIGSSGTTSGYSRDDSKLGGGFQFDNSPVMTVVTNSRSYWRGETREYYTGTGWIDDARDTSGPQSVGNGESLDNPQLGSMATKEVTQQITMQSQDNYPVLFGAYSISRVDIPIAAGSSSRRPRLIWDYKRSTMNWGGFAGGTKAGSSYPKAYTVVSEVPDISEDELDNATFEELYGTNIDEANSYLQMPSSFPESVKELAEQVTVSSSTPYGKVKLLRDYLRSNFTYTNSPDLTRKQSKDFVGSFLFEIKEGYCDYFSTALVMMARSLDIPARWVKGYAPGQISSSPEAAAKSLDPDQPLETYIVTNADAHSWAEVYLGETYGWVPVEATPGFSLPENSVPQTQADEPEEEQQPEQQEENVQPEQQPAGDSGTPIPVSLIGWGLAAVVLLWAGFTVWRNRTALYFGLLRIRHGHRLSNAEKVVSEARRWQSLMRRQGYDRADHETIREAVLRWEREQPQAAEHLQPLLRQFEQAKYSADSIGGEDWRETVRLSRELKSFLRSNKQNKQNKRGRHNKQNKRNSHKEQKDTHSSG
ncbi:transglutaminase TgpA family protein [Paenibacillus pinistramenti]|uniref:transglutaminase TgpA family protein n=1 Tax=Paenibacillus pinistramenti TaxID=1768003 RepID=UPI0011098B19|nr:transglutaminaseTgpA domain-containing protein [Paenibacillus pinistramenti]